MDEHDWMADRFEEHRTHLRAVAYRMLGSVAEADDAVQESWIRLSRSGASGVENLGGWLTTVTARVCLDMLRSRQSRREEPVGVDVPEPAVSRQEPAGPEQEVLLADSVGLALLVVLEALAPAERVAFVLHDMFDLPFDQIGPIVGRSPAAARQLASRARRRVQGTVTAPDADLARQREVVDAFLAASRGGDFGALVTALDPEVAFFYAQALSEVPLPEYAVPRFRAFLAWFPDASERFRSAAQQRIAELTLQQDSQLHLLADDMKKVTRDLRRQKTDKPVQVEQEQFIEKLQKLIEEYEQKQAGGPPTGPASARSSPECYSPRSAGTAPGSPPMPFCWPSLLSATVAPGWGLPVAPLMTTPVTAAQEGAERHSSRAI